MTIKFEYKKICQSCGNVFVAQKSITKYCSDTCANRGNKEEKRQKRLQNESEAIKERNRQNLLAKENLSLTDAATLLGISRPTLYKLLNERGAELLRISKRTIRVKKSDLLNLYQNQTQKPTPINTSIAEINRQQEDYLTVAEALQLFKISNSYLYNKIREKQIQPVVIKGKAHYPKKVLEKLFVKKQYTDITEWYTVAEIIEKFGVSQQYVYEYTSNYKTPKKRKGKTVLISKYHWDKSRGLETKQKANITTQFHRQPKNLVSGAVIYMI